MGVPASVCEVCDPSVTARLRAEKNEKRTMGVLSLTRFAARRAGVGTLPIAFRLLVHFLCPVPVASSSASEASAEPVLMSERSEESFGFSRLKKKTGD